MWTKGGLTESDLGYGFKATYYAVYDGARGPGDGRITLAAGVAQMIESPSYGSSNGVAGTVENRKLPPNLDLEYFITAKTGPISLSFIDMWFQEDPNCLDNITIYDGSSRSAVATAPPHW